MISRKYNSPVWQTRVKNYLNSLHVSDYVAKGLEISALLSKIYRQILQLSRQVPPSHQGDPHRIRFLRRAVNGYSWSHETFFRVATHGLTFQQLFEELETALQLYKEAQIVPMRNEAPVELEIRWERTLSSTRMDNVDTLNHQNQAYLKLSRSTHYLLLGDSIVGILTTF